MRNVGLIGKGEIDLNRELDPTHGRNYQIIRDLSDNEFLRIRNFLYNHSGINLCPAKKAMVTSRLQKRVAHYHLTNFNEYYELVESGAHPEELQLFVDLLTTNETYFFREPEHFRFLAEKVVSSMGGNPLKIWSGASSSGEEIYSIAMVLAEIMRHKDWSILGTDISSRMLRQAARGHYTFDRTSGISKERMHKYCLKGVRSHEGTFMISDQLKSHVHFKALNLNHSLPNLGMFEVIFLRNVLIYFDQSTKEMIVRRVIDRLKPGGYFFISHTESLHNIDHGLEMVKPSIFYKPLKIGLDRH